jgi:hypothetical protein
MLVSVSPFEIMRVVVTLAASPLVPPRMLPPLPAPAAPHVPASSSSSLDEGTICSAPFFYSGDGIKRYVLECLSAGGGASDAMVPDCTVPYTFDEAGRHHYIDACMEASGAPCDVPFSYDSDGTKHYKTACLSD